MMTQETALSVQAAKLFAALKDCGPGWHSRAEIAERIAKRRLNGFEAAALDLLVQSGRIEAERRPIAAPIRERWEYRVKE
jgi:hypothetical protein